MSEITRFFLNPHNDKKVSIFINEKEYGVPTHFSMNDSEQYLAELTKDGDYKKAIAVIVHKKLNSAYGAESPLLQDVINTNDVAFSEYIFAVVANSKELQQIFDDTDDTLPMRQRFGIAHKVYIDMLGKQLTDAMRPVLENYNQLIKNIDFSGLYRFQELVNKMRPAWLDAIDGITRTTQMIANAVQPFQQIAASITEAVSKITIPTISQEEKELWEQNYKKWGEIGWPVLPNAPFNFFNGFPEDTKTANKLAMQFCDTKSMDKLFKELHEQDIKKADLDSAIFCYKSKQYKACALMIFCLIDSKMIKLQPKTERREVGLRATKKLNVHLDEKLSKTHFFISALYQINLMTCLGTYFANGNNFIKEPDTINRNFVNHGMNVRTVRKRDCIQLFIALNNLLEFLDYL
jgi:hypothetical protein